MFSVVSAVHDASIAPFCYTRPMEWRSVRKAALYLIPVATLAFFFAASFGVMHIGMKMDSDGHMHDCPFMAMAVICDMTPFQHMSAWQSTFATMVAKDMYSALLLTLALFAIWRPLVKLRPMPRVLPIRHHDDAEVMLYANPLKEAFANGILHPKVF